MIWRPAFGMLAPFTAASVSFFAMGSPTAYRQLFAPQNPSGAVRSFMAGYVDKSREIGHLSRVLYGAVWRRKGQGLPWMVATLDGTVEATGAVFESKFMLPWSFSEEAAAEKYMAQVQHNMWVTHLR